MAYFLLHYDNDQDQATVRRFDDRGEAYVELKRGTIAKEPEDELVLFLTDSEATLRRTHPRYFYNEFEMVQQAGQRLLKELDKADAEVA